MGRRERPLDPNGGPVARFAFELRKLRQEAGGPTYRGMAARAHYSPATLAQAAAGDRLPSLPVALAYVEACGGDTAAWRTRWHEVSREVLEEAAAADDSQAPYLGLARFETEDHERFFGRAALVERLAGLVHAHRVVMLVGPSGSGKSSLLRAGLVPHLRQAGRSGERPASIRVLTPGAQPAGTYAEWSDGVIIVDQFEEVFALCDDAARRRDFIDALLAAGAAEGGSRVVIAVRADFFGRCAEHRELTEAVRDATLLMSPMSPAELREAIIGPAAGAGLVVERELTARIIGEVEDEPGALPLMSHALLETWRRRHGRVLTTAAYEAAGGIHTSIARTSEDLYTALSPAQQKRLRHLLLRLVNPGHGAQDTRRPVDRGELLTGDDDTELLLERLAHARLITLDEGRVDLAHEALLTAWPRFRGWIGEERERMRVQRRLTEAAHAWQDHDRDAGSLYRGVRLSTACEQFASFDGLTPLEREFLTAGIAARDRERRHRRRRTVAISTLLVLTLVAALLAWQQGETSRIRQREAEARRAAGVAASLRDSDPVTAMRLSVAAWRLADLPETRSALLAAAHQRLQDVFIAPDGDPETMRHLSMDGRSLVSIGADQVTTWDLQTHRRTASLPGVGSEAVGVRNGDAWKLPTRGRDGEVTLWDLSTGRRDERVLGRANGGVEMGVSGRSVIGYETAGSRYLIRVWGIGSHRELLEVATPRRTSAQSTTVTWDVGSAFLRWGRNGRRIPNPDSPDATLSPDDRLMAVCLPGERLQLWNVATGRRIDVPWAPRVTRRQCQSEHVSFTPDSRRLTVITDEKIRMWEIASGDELTGFSRRNIQEIGFSADGAFLVASDGVAIIMWRVTHPDLPVFRHDLSGEPAFDLRVDPRANWIRYLGGSGLSWPMTVRTISLGRAVTSEWKGAAASTVAFSPDGTTLALGYPMEKPDAVRFRLHDRRSGRRTADLPEMDCPGPNHGTPACSAHVAFSSDGRTLAFGRSTGRKSSPTRMSLWDVARRRTTDTLVLDQSAMRTVGALGFAPGDTSVLIASSTLNTGSLSVWDLRQKAVTKTLAGVFASELAIRPDQRLMVTSQGDVVELPSVTKAPGQPSLGRASALAFSPDGRHLAAGDHTGRTVLWDARVERRLGVLAAQVTASSDPLNATSALAFSPDGGVLAAGGADGSVQLWDVASHQPIGPAWPTTGDVILALAFSPDGRSLYTAGEHVPVQKYDLAPDALETAVCRRAGRGLTDAEWRTYFPNDLYHQTCSSRTGS
ncbi:WD40 repeat domain-containing protein [Nonomuraea basaltis]|uniref:WD40 repeat domain-containing protein n=1 Tax=Nonomuraea basaltis TaxID=2495887 RepID=UPI00110C6C2C|nr:WD40 repeat domain-containing protein [Nonomuraea basaltis]TMR89426.1 hypothetical protein EJK15_60870 [Nonomuraea basaltis]